MARMEPLPIEACEDPELRKIMEHFVETLGFVPNSLLTMQRVPELAKATVQFNRAVFGPHSTIDLGFKRLLAHAASAAVGCQYCRAHTAVSAGRQGIDDEKIAALWEYRTSELFDDRERIAIDYAMAAASVPNAVNDELYADLEAYWSEDEIVEILGVVCMFGVFNRWNDSMATTLEAEPVTVGGQLLQHSDWSIGKHGPAET